MVFLALIGILLGLLVIRHYTWHSLPWPEGAVRPSRYQGHRGYWKEGAQENTLASFAAAKQRGLDMIEMDIRLSQDQIPIVFHDSDLKRLAGVAKEVHQCTAVELFRWAQAPTLEQVLLSSQVPSKLNIELKTSSITDGTLEEKVAELIQRHKAEGRVLFSSFNPLSLWRLSRHLPEVPRALLASREKEPGNHIYLRRLWLAPYVRIHALHLDYHDVRVEDLRRWKKRKIPVALWTVNGKDMAEAYLQAGAFSIITDTLVD